MQKSTFTSVKNLRYFVPKPNQMTMNKKLLTVALSLTVIPSVLLAQKSATEHTIRANEAVKTELNFNDRQDYEDANRGFRLEEYERCRAIRHPTDRCGGRTTAFWKHWSYR